jgi:hypothetical protein
MAHTIKLFRLARRNEAALAADGVTVEIAARDSQHDYFHRDSRSILEATKSSISVKPFDMILDPLHDYRREHEQAHYVRDRDANDCDEGPRIA